jgi:hypothetical protein
MSWIIGGIKKEADQETSDAALSSKNNQSNPRTSSLLLPLFERASIFLCVEVN